MKLQSMTAVLWSLIGLNLITMIVGGLVTWLGYAIPNRLEQFGLRPGTIVVAGFASVLSSCLGLCALNYSSYLMLGVYGALSSLYALVLLFGLPDIWYKSDKYVTDDKKLDIIYYSLIATLMIKSASAFIYSYYLKCKEKRRKSLSCTCDNQLLTSSNTISNNNNNNNNNDHLHHQPHHLPNSISRSQELNLKDIYMPRISPYGRLSYPSRSPTKSSCPIKDGGPPGAIVCHMTDVISGHTAQQQQQQQQQIVGQSSTTAGTNSLSRVNSSNQMLIADPSGDPALDAAPPPPSHIKTIQGKMAVDHHSHDHHRQQQQHQHPLVPYSTLSRPLVSSGNVPGKPKKSRYSSSSVAAVTAAAAAALFGGVADGNALVANGHGLSITCHGDGLQTGHMASDCYFKYDPALTSVMDTCNTIDGASCPMNYDMQL